MTWDHFDRGWPQTLQELAARLGVTERTVRRWIDEGMPKPGFDGYNVAEIRRWRLRKSPTPDPRTGKLFGRKRRW